MLLALSPAQVWKTAVEEAMEKVFPFFFFVLLFLFPPLFLPRMRLRKVSQAAVSCDRRRYVTKLI
jgi:hypothetical protein